MVLESLFNPFTLKKKPWEMFFAGFLYSVVGLFLSYLVFREVSGLFMVFLIVMAALPILYTTIKREEEIDLKYRSQWKILKEHSGVIVFLLFLFLGITVALSLAYVVLPAEVTSAIFSLQEQAIIDVNSYIQGNFTKIDIFIKILVNNLKVLFFCLVFSFMYGSGALFILTWNASVIATAIGSLFKTEISKVASLVGFHSVAAYFGVATFSFLRYMTHGVFEIIAYFVAGLAGSIISISIIKRDFNKDSVVMDALDLILISLGILVVAGVIEVFITPVLFG